MIDLSIPVESNSPSEPWTPEIDYWDHEVGGDKLAENLRESGYGENLSHEDFPDGKGLAWEEITAIIHTGTHMDAPWHYGPESEGEPSKTIDEIPAEWCRGNAVVLDFTWKEPRTEISAAAIDEQLEELNHDLSPGEIVLIETGADKLWGTEEYLTEFPGMGAEATKHLVNQGIKVIGIDAYGFDVPLNHRKFYPFYTKCAELGVPVVMQVGHSAIPTPNKHGKPILLDDIAIDFPELDLVGSHTGWPWTEELVAHAWVHPNVYIGTAAYAPQYWDESLVNFMRSHGRDKVLWGTDYPVVDFDQSLSQLEEFELSNEVESKVLAENAESIFDL